MRRISGQRRGEGGFAAVVVMVAILAVLMIYTTANVRVLVHLQNELKLIEQQQLRCLNGASAGVPAAGNAPVESPASRETR
jgi:hypothetical protein